MIGLIVYIQEQIQQLNISLRKYDRDTKVMTLHLNQNPKYIKNTSLYFSHRCILAPLKTEKDKRKQISLQILSKCRRVLDSVVSKSSNEISIYRASHAQFFQCTTHSVAHPTTFDNSKL